MQREAKWLKFCLFTSAATLWWSSIGPLSNLRLKSSSCVTPSWYARWAVVEGLTSAIGKKYACLSAWMTKVIVLQLCWMLPSKVGLNFHSQLFILLLKEGYTMMLLGVCSASILLLHEHSPLHCHVSSVVLVRRQCFGRCCFCAVFNRLRIAREIYFPCICEHAYSELWMPECAPLVHQHECGYRPSGKTMVPWTCNQSDFCLADRKHSKPQNQHNILRGVKSQNVHYFT